MGTPSGPLHRLAWQGTVGQMLAHGTRVRQICAACETWADVDIEALARFRGRAADLWGQTPPCGRCGQPARYHASPGSASPFRPLFETGGRP